jgi:Kef-type K+ transport system membrane component KefB
MQTLVLFFLIPLLSITFLFVKDDKKERKQIMNVLLIVNAVFFLSPIFIAYLNTPHGESLWNENTGGGEALWLYIIIFPISVIAQLVLLVLKIIYATKKNENDMG